MEHGQDGWKKLTTPEEMEVAGLARGEVVRYGKMMFEKDPPHSISPQTVGEVVLGLEVLLAKGALTDVERQDAQALLDEFRSTPLPSA